jgi:hypothetical protein
MRNDADERVNMSFQATDRRKSIKGMRWTLTLSTKFQKQRHGVFFIFIFKKKSTYDYLYRLPTTYLHDVYERE